MHEKSPELAHVLAEVSARHDDPGRWKRTVLSTWTGDEWSGPIAEWPCGSPLTVGCVMGAILDSGLVSADRFRLQVQHAKGSNKFNREFSIIREHQAEPTTDLGRAVVGQYAGQVETITSQLISSIELANRLTSESAEARAKALDEREQQFSKLIAVIESISDWAFVPVSTVSIAVSIHLLEKSGVEPVQTLAMIQGAVERAESALRGRGLNG